MKTRRTGQFGVKVREELVGPVAVVVTGENVGKGIVGNTPQQFVIHRLGQQRPGCAGREFWISISKARQRRFAVIRVALYRQKERIGGIAYACGYGIH